MFDIMLGKYGQTPFSIPTLRGPKNIRINGVSIFN